ncbi:disulfide bond formation protein DsbA [Halobiforma lacisalsi AJ5]|uniref:DSBA oxidoreductase n=1 Tax=Natronobacterium lacisalsi AJ5 TaxID=358396 RepID=M0LRG2_NATLA|nr:thioredoxin domain-containing protein [Halobiforma lacisalsi]APW99757.1 disulfide bond formation protein DsbA [Halobiforma lacisalsi AJ5]EMA36066.1 DSBA oxidoreductase [Halobiforma lacisalsi AJ5]
MHRRSFLAAAGVSSVALAGCATLFDASMPAALEDVDPDRQVPTPTLGDGQVTVAVYEDLGCSHCLDFETDVFPILEDEYVATDEIEFRHYDFPVMAADESIAMANAARAVQDGTRGDGQDEDEDGSGDPNGLFFDYKQAVMTGDDEDWTDDGLVTLAESLESDAAGGPDSDPDNDPDAVATALENETYYPTLAADWERGDERDVTGTPTVFVDGESVDRATDPDAVVETIEDAL